MTICSPLPFYLPKVSLFLFDAPQGPASNLNGTRSCTFKSYLVRVHSLEEIQGRLQDHQKAVAVATRNASKYQMLDRMFAYRISRELTSEKSTSDQTIHDGRFDGEESGSGERLLHLLTTAKLVNVLLIITLSYNKAHKPALQKLKAQKLVALARSGKVLLSEFKRLLRPALIAVAASDAKNADGSKVTTFADAKQSWQSEQNKETEQQKSLTLDPSLYLEPEVYPDSATDEEVPAVPRYVLLFLLL